MSGYELSRRWFDFAFQESECKVQHTALYMWIIEVNNRLGWKKEFGLPTHDTMEGLSIGNKNTYYSALRDLQKWKFIEIVKESKNQYQANIIKICRYENEPALDSALDSALIQQCTGIDASITTSIDASIVPIDKPINKETSKQINDEEEEKSSSSDFIIKTKEQILEEIKNKKPPELRPPPLTLDDYEELLQNDITVKNAACNTRNLTEAEFHLALRDFFLEKKAEIHEPKDEKDIRKHFLNWIKFWKENQNKSSDGKGKIQKSIEVTLAAGERIKARRAAFQNEQ